MGTTILFIILFITIFLVGYFASVSVAHAREHFRPDKGDKPEAEPLPPEVRARLLKESETNFQKVLTNSATYLQSGLVETATDLNNLVKNLVTNIINGELENYHRDLAEIRKKADAELGTVKSGIDGHTDELKAQLAAEMAAEKKKMIQLIDIKLGDAVASFLVEALGHNVDLGAQSEYLTSLLEEHKAEFVKEIAGDDAELTQPASSEPKPAGQAAQPESGTSDSVEAEVKETEQSVPAKSEEAASEPAETAQ